MKKKTANIVMAVIILAIITAGIIGAGFYKGWFDKPSEDTALLCDIKGIIDLERDGIGYTVTEDTVLRKGDRISADAGATVRINIGDGYIVLGQSAVTEILDPATETLSLSVEKGEAFVDTRLPVTLGFEGRQSVIENAVATLIVHKGAQTISVYYGKVEDAKAGHSLEWTGGERSVNKLDINSLNDFNIAQLRRVDSAKKLVFSLEELDALEADRWAQLRIPEETEAPDTTPSDETAAETEAKDTEAITDTEEITEIDDTTDTEEYIPDDITESVDTTTADTTTAETTAAETTKPKETTPKETKPKETIPKETEPPETTPPEPEKLTCTITIRCDTILDNYDELDPAKAPYVPDSGCILPVTTVEFTEGETVFEVLNRVCGQYGIQIEYSWTPMYDSYYIEGINNLYEFDCGYESGWMYKVDGWFPNYGCSSYELTGGESIVWCYTCKGLGEDVGAKGME